MVIFHGDTRVWKHSVAASKLYAAMLRTPIAGAVDGSGYSYAIDRFGRVVSKTTEENSFILVEL